MPGLGLRLELSDLFRIGAGYQLDLRTFPERADEQERVHLADVRLRYRPALLGKGPEKGFLTVAPIGATAMMDGSVRAVRVGPNTEVTWQRLSLSVSLWAGSIEAGSLGRAWQVGSGVSALVRLSKNLDLSGTMEFIAVPWAAASSADAYGRRYVGMGVVAHATGRSSLRRREGSYDLRPVVHEGRARFRVRATGADNVNVVGSWDDWASPGPALTRTRAPGLWEVWVDVPAGSHRYRFVVDGRSIRPPDAPRYQRDDFGGEDGVIDVPTAGPSVPQLISGTRLSRVGRRG